MNRKLRNTIVLAATLLLLLPVAAYAMKITSLTAIAKGQGSVSVAEAETQKIVAVSVILKENGEADITLYADIQLFGTATWTAPEDLSQGIDLKITGGIVSGNAKGTGKLFLRDDGKSIDSLTLSATSADNSKLTVKFKAEAEKAEAKP